MLFAHVNICQQFCRRHIIFTHCAWCGGLLTCFSRTMRIMNRCIHPLNTACVCLLYCMMTLFDHIMYLCMHAYQSIVKFVVCHWLYFIIFSNKFSIHPTKLCLFYLWNECCSKPMTEWSIYDCFRSVQSDTQKLWWYSQVTVFPWLLFIIDVYEETAGSAKLYSAYMLQPKVSWRFVCRILSSFSNWQLFLDFSENSCIWCIYWDSFFWALPQRDLRTKI